MKRGKDDEKNSGPMFPRLHVNDTEKGGPRAPPRNKMALYEQLSIPSQRINPGVSSLNSSNSSNFAPRDSSVQERNRVYHHVSTSTPVENYHGSQLEGVSSNAQVARFEQRKKAGEEDDYRVPVFNTETSQCRSLSRTQGNGLNRSSSSVSRSNKEIREQGEERLRVCSSREHQMNSASNSSTRQKIDGSMNESRPLTYEDYRDQPASRSSGSSRLHSNKDCSKSVIQMKDDGCRVGFESVRDVDNKDLSRAKSESRSGEERGSPGEPANEVESRGVEVSGSQQILYGDKSDDVSETSMVDSGSAMDVSPDEVVGVIGQNRFWKARRAILNQQRAFAVQVFELHRLIKVQRLIAGSPHMLLEDGAYLAKTSFKGSAPKKLTSAYAVKPVLQIQCKEDSGKLSHKLECSAENAVDRVENVNQHSNYGLYPGNQPPTPMPAYNNANPWFYHQSHMQQWLVPVMTPSEGLVYKPYQGPAFAGTAWGGCGSFGPPPMTPPLHHQGMGFFPGAPQSGQVYFPPYGMQAMNPAMTGSATEQMNQFAQPGSHGQVGPLSGEGANFNPQQQNPLNLVEKTGANSRIILERYRSTASSPRERIQGDRGISNAAKGGNALPLFPTTQTAPDEAAPQPTRVIRVVPHNPRSAPEEGASQPYDAEQPTRVIRVVPHNPRSANESAARIFQSIQEERRHHDSA